MLWDEVAPKQGYWVRLTWRAIFFSGTGCRLPQQGFGVIHLGHWPHSMPGEGGAGSQRGANRDIGGDQSRAPFLGQMIKGQTWAKTFSPVVDLPPKVWTDTESPSTGHADIQQVARHLLKNYDGEEPGHSAIQNEAKEKITRNVPQREAGLWQSLGGVGDWGWKMAEQNHMDYSADPGRKRLGGKSLQ